ncbi:MAG: hypothetical protein WDW36_007457 [Sanguina aurantia]
MPSFGHSSRGVNVMNLRSLGPTRETKNGYIAPYSWAQETLEQIDGGREENRLSSTLRLASTQLQVLTGTIMVNDIGGVEDALRVKLAQTGNLRQLLEGALTEVLAEIEAVVSLRVSLEGRLRKVREKQELNASRLLVRQSRPGREHTMDEVERHLLSQQQLLAGSAEKVRRSVTALDREAASLDAVRGRLAADLKDKADAMRVDESVLAGGPTLAGKTPRTWVRGTTENVQDAHHWLADSARLRKAVRHAMAASCGEERAQRAALDTQLQRKLGATRALQAGLARQLTAVRQEQAEARAQRAALTAALDAQRGPLAQARERIALRKMRPGREAVADDADAALSREVAHLHAATAQLAEQVHAVDKEAAHLDAAAAMLEGNLADKDAALQLDERVTLLDGRANLAMDPPYSVASFAFTEVSMSVARSATIKRIEELESGLMTARSERLSLEASIRQMRGSIAAGLSI